MAECFRLSYDTRMKNLIFLLSLTCLPLFAAIAEFEQYPEDREYTSVDRGLRPYRALTVYKTGTFTLTFDDGPDPVRTPLILDILKKHDVKATFFVLTMKVNEATYPLIKRMLDEGHIVASHGPSHDRVRDLSRAQFKTQLEQSFLDLAKWYQRAGHPFDKHYFRFPYGDYGTRKDYHHINVLRELSTSLMGENCIHMAFWDIDTADWVPGMTPQEVASNIIAHNEGGIFMDFKKQGDRYVKVPVLIKDPPAGGVILQHDVHDSSILGTDLFLKYAKERGLSIVRLDEIEEFKITKSCQL